MILDIGEGGKPSTTGLGGRYDDVYVKTAQGWRFKRRQFIPSAPAPRAAASAPSAPVRPAPSARVGSVPAPGPLTAQDYLDLRALAVQYSYGLVTGADEGWLYANGFTEDGEFHGPPAVPGGKPFDAKGRAQLRTFAVPGGGPNYVRHFTSNHAIEATPEGARGKLYLLVIDIARDGKPTSVNMGGHYEDDYVRTGEGWRIKTRRFFRSKSAQTVQAEAAASK
jgi:hypothetical protein